jgi:predicted transcriptional regulator
VKEQDHVLLLSIRPRYAESILNGTKLAEIRRQRLNVQPGTAVIIYATQPIAAVVGSARIAEACQGAPADVWVDYHTQMDISRDEFDGYLAGAVTAHILVMKDIQRLRTPLTLTEMRATAAFHPPRSYRYITAKELRELVNGHPSGDLLLDLL